jgi:hypothetical protein
METAKKDLKLIEPSTETSDPQKTSTAPRLDVKTQISKKEKMDIYEATRRRAQDRGREEGKPVNKDQLVNKINYINFKDDTLLINLKHRNYHSRKSSGWIKKPSAFFCRIMVMKLAPER